MLDRSTDGFRLEGYMYRCGEGVGGREYVWEMGVVGRDLQTQDDSG